MTDFIQSGKAGAAKMPCAWCEEVLADALDGTLSPSDQAAFDLHLLSCPACTGMLADAQRGAAWLEMLRDPRPEPSPALLARILAQTSGVQTSGAQAGEIQPGSFVSPAVTAPVTARILPFRSRIAAAFRPSGNQLLQPRLAMTAAMAFFSVALTLNLTGLRLSAIRLSDLRPSAIKRSFYAANAGIVRYYDNLSVVYQLESSVHDLQSDWNADEPSAPRQQTPEQPSAQPQEQPKAQPDGQPNDQPNAQPQHQKKQQESGPGRSSRQSAPLPLADQAAVLQPARPVLIAALNDREVAHPMGSSSDLPGGAR